MHNYRTRRLSVAWGPEDLPRRDLKKGRTHHEKHNHRRATSFRRSGVNTFQNRASMVPQDTRPSSGTTAGGETLWELSVIQCSRLVPKGAGELQCLAVSRNPMDWLHRALLLWPELHARAQDASTSACLLDLGGSQ